MTNKFFLILLSILVMLSLCSCKKLDNNSEGDVEFTFETSDEENGVEYDNRVMLEQHRYKSDTFGDLNSLVFKESELNPKTRLFLNSVYAELPSFDTHYYDAELPSEVYEMLNSYGMCYLVVKANTYTTTDEIPYLTFETIKFVKRDSGEIFAVFPSPNTVYENPKLFYDNGHFYLLGYFSDNRILYQLGINIDCTKRLGNVDTLLLDNPNIIYTYSNVPYTLVQKSKGKFSFMCLNKEILSFEANIKASDIEFFTPFIDKSKNLILLNTVNYDDLFNTPAHPEFLLVETGVNHKFSDNIYLDFVHDNRNYNYCANLYQKDDGSYFIYGIEHLGTNASIEKDENFSYYHYLDSKTIDESLHTAYLTMDEYNRVSLHIDMTIEDNEASIDEYICSVPLEKVYDNNVQKCLNMQFDFSDTSEFVHKLLDYINS